MRRCAMEEPRSASRRASYFRLRRLDYDEAALRKWSQIVKGLPGEVFVFFKHEDEARGPMFAKQFLRLMNS